MAGVREDPVDAEEEAGQGARRRHSQDEPCLPLNPVYEP